MERSAQVNSIKCSLSHLQPVYGSREPSPPFVSFPHKTTDASFSSYLQPPQPQLNNNLVEDSEISIFDAQKYFNESSTSNSSDPRVSKRISPVEVLNLESVPRLSSADGYGRNYRARSFHATPTASSEASWNSQTGLLANPPGAIAVSIRNPNRVDEKKKGSATKWLLGRKCPCAGKKSVQVEENVSESRTPSSHPGHKSKEVGNMERQIPSCVATDWLQRQRQEISPNSQRISANKTRFPSGISEQQQRVASSNSIRAFGNDGFTFPILNQTSSPIKLTLNGHRTPPLEDPARDSLEVFKPSEDVVSSKTAMEVHHHQSLVVPTSPKSRTTVMDDDIASDASSDLFEIESFSTQTAYQMYNSNSNRRESMDDISYNNNNGKRLYCRQSLDETISVTECYEPSEASIDWSVTTAEALERASVTNFSEAEQEIGQYNILKKISGDNSSSNGGWGKRSGGGGGLLSCRHEKAVSVGPNPVKWGGGGENSRVTVRHVSSRPPNPQHN
ncbi:protein PHYTOCHROME KINASE SUBSTRATE 4 [Euphorbia lathyris]|uniref:protein PHYTOCHROME KINASE SUBSTRATE 4 n=1 Tax=Euphorbia lathyris TaxID=212925 RepID=UPI0033132174